VPVKEPDSRLMFVLETWTDMSVWVGKLPKKFKVLSKVLFNTLKLTLYQLEEVIGEIKSVMLTLFQLKLPENPDP